MSAQQKIIVFGSSYMAEEYLKVLNRLKKDVVVISRNSDNASSLAKKYGYEGYGGSSEKLKDFGDGEISHAIIASAIPSLKDLTIACMKKGIKNILAEKPGAINIKEIKEVKENLLPNTNLYYALNRRFYNSVLQLRDLSSKEGVNGCFFDFTEREKDVVQNTQETPEVMARWGLANSMHVIDTAFFLAGKPTSLISKQSGSWDCHPSGTIFSGSGETDKCLFSYFSSWEGAGRWNVEISTPKGRYKLSPLEELQFCAQNQFAWEQIELPDDDDANFKPGLLKMTTTFLEQTDNIKLLPKIDEMIDTFTTINKICGYEDE